MPLELIYEHDVHNQTGVSQIYKAGERRAMVQVTPVFNDYGRVWIVQGMGWVWCDNGWQAVSRHEEMYPTGVDDRNPSLPPSIPPTWWKGS